MNFTPEEYGRPLPPAPPTDPKGQPRGEARFPLPHPTTFGGIVNWSSRVYSYLFDQAVSHSRENAERMRLDPMIDACMRLLVEPVSLLSFHIDPDDDEDEYQVRCAEQAQKVLKWMPGFVYAKRHLLDEGIFVGRAGQFVRWQNQFKMGRTWMVPTAFDPVQGDKLVFFFDGRIGVRVHGGFTGPSEQITPTDFSRAYVLDAAEREQLILHQSDPTDATFWKPFQAGQVHGVGLRDKLYWLWALKQRVWGMSMDYLAWFAKGLTIFYFDAHNNEHATEMRAWIEAQDGNTAMLMPHWTGKDFTPVQRFEAATASPAFLQELITKYFDDMIRLVILGQSLTSGVGPTGLGSGVASAHQMTIDQKIKYRAVGLDDTLTRDLLGPFYRANFPGCPCGHWVSDLDDPNAQSMIDNAKEIYAMGGAVPEEPLLEAGGLPQAKPGDTILTNVAGMQPAATDQAPLGVPVQESPNSGADGSNGTPDSVS